MLHRRQARCAVIASALLFSSIIDAAPSTRPAADLYNLSADAFLASDAAQRPIDVTNVDGSLLAAAIFHQTNRVRAEHKLPPLRHAPLLQSAAQMHADDMVAGDFFAHENPTDASKREPIDRVKLKGYRPSVVAENLATEFAIQYEAGRPFYEVAGGISYQPRGRPLPPHTYATFAKAVLTAWMNSPGHRQNVLATEPTELGTAAALKQPTDDQPLVTFYCVQNFGSPLDFKATH